MYTGSLVWTEWLMIAVFIAGVVFWGFRLRRVASESMAGSFLADRKISGFIASLSTVATNLNINDFIGGAGLAYMFGAIMAHGQILTGIVLMIVSIVLVPKIRRINAYSLGEWLEKRYSARIGISYSVVWAMVWMLFNLGLYIYGGAFVLNMMMGWPLYPSIVILSIIAAFYTLLGGLGAVVATDILQLCLMFFPFIFVSASVWIDVGGPIQLAASLPEAKSAFWVTHTPFGHIGIFLLSFFIMGTSYWSCEAQVIQRPLASSSEEDASVSFLGAAFWFTLLVPILITLPALAAIKIAPNLENPDMAMIVLIRKYLPHGLYGVTVLGLIAGFFSSADSQINAFCALFTTDVYRRLLRPGKTESHYVLSSKIAGIIFTLAAIGTAILFSKAGKGMMLFALSILVTIMPPFGAITIGGAILRVFNACGAFVGLIAGGLVSIGLVIADVLGYLKPIAEETLYFRAMVSFVITFVLALLVSLIFKDKATVETEQQDMTINISSKLKRMIILLIIATIAITAFWSYCF